MNDDERYREGTPTSEEEDEDFTAELDEPAGKMFVQTRSGLGAEEENTELDSIPQERRIKALSLLNELLEESSQPIDPEVKKRQLGSNWKGLMYLPKKMRIGDIQNTETNENKSNQEIKSNIEDEKRKREEIDRIVAEVMKKKQITTQETKVKFAGQEITIEKEEVTDQPSALDTLLSSISDKKTINTMDKTSYDWEKFKKESGEKDEVEKAKQDGFIEKQEFLNRVDQRRFEIEKAEREKERNKHPIERPR